MLARSIRISMGYSNPDEEFRMMEMQIKQHSIHAQTSVLTEEEIKSMQEAVSEIFIDKFLLRYIVNNVSATRTHGDVLFGASPRGSLGMMRAAQAMAMFRGQTGIFGRKRSRINL